MTSPAPSTPNRLPLFLGLGCAVLIFGCCLTGVGGFFAWRYHVAEAARSHATTFLTQMVARDYPGAFTTAISRWDSDLYTVGEFTMCFGNTPLATMSSATCHDVSVEENGGSALVDCTVTLPTGGTTEITVDVNNPTDEPYLGFVWFSPDALVGPAWHSETCATWSGQMYFREPPPGRVRP